MPFVLPDFHLLCDVYNSTTSGGLGTLRLHNVPCQLVYSYRTQVLILKVAAKTDIRPRAAAPQVGYFGDFVDVPAGTANYMSVNLVYDVARGYPNEYRSVACSRDPSQTTFPIG